MTLKTKQTLGLALAITMILGGISPALPFAEAVPIQKQLDAGMALEELTCDNPAHKLAIRENGKPICAKEKTLQRLGLEPIETNANESNTNELTATKTQITFQTISKNDDQTKISEGLTTIPYWPKYTITFPEQAVVGEPFEVIYNYTYAVPDDEGNYEEFEERCEADYCQDDSLYVSANDYVTLHGIDLDAYDTWTDETHLPFRGFYDGYVRGIYDVSGPQQKVFQFTINEPDLDYRYGMITIQKNAHYEDHIYFHVDANGYVTLTQKELQNKFQPIMLNDISTKYVYASIHDYVDGKYLLDNLPTNSSLQRDTLYERWHEDYHGVPTAGQHVEQYQMIGIDDFSDPVILDDFVDFLLEHYPSENYREYLKEPEWQLSDDVIEYILSARPELDAQSIPDYQLFPQAYGQSPSFSYVIGKLVNYDENNIKYNVKNAKVCAYDHHYSSGMREPVYTQLLNGRTPVCTQTSSSGSFSLQFPNSDPNGSRYVDLVLVAFTENRHVVIAENNNLDTHDVKSQPRSEHSSRILRYGDFNIKSPYVASYDHSQKAFVTLDKLTKISKWYKSNVSYSSPKLTAIWNPDACGSVGFDPTSKKMTLGHSSFVDLNQRSQLCVNHVISPLYNDDTLAHEFAHFAFYSVYDSKRSQYPTYQITARDGIHSPVHNNGPGTAWVEGWAFFMSLMYNDSHLYQPSYMLGQWNFEDRTHNERVDSKFRGKSFIDGINGEGNVAAALWDAVDRNNEQGDNQSVHIRAIWNAMADTKERDESVIATDILQWKADYDDNRNPSLESIFVLNTLSSGTQTSNNQPSQAQGSIIVSDQFANMGKWVLTNEDGDDWESKRYLGSSHPTAKDWRDRTAQSDNCDDKCWMHLKHNIDLTRYTSANLSFILYVDKSADNEEGIYLEFSRDGGRTWIPIDSWTEDSGHDDEVWRNASYNLADYLDVNNFNVRITGVSSSSSEDMQVDNFEIRGVERPVSRGGGGGSSSNQTPAPAPDRTAPVITVNDLPSTVRTNSVTISGTISDNESSIKKSQIKLDDGSWQSIESSFSKTFANLSEGTHTITIKSENSKRLTQEKTITVNVQIPNTIDDIGLLLDLPHTLHHNQPITYAAPSGAELSIALASSDGDHFYTSNIANSDASVTLLDEFSLLPSGSYDVMLSATYQENFYSLRDKISFVSTGEIDAMDASNDPRIDRIQIGPSMTPDSVVKLSLHDVSLAHIYFTDWRGNPSIYVPVLERGNTQTTMKLLDPLFLVSDDYTVLIEVFYNDGSSFRKIQQMSYSQ